MIGRTIGPHHIVAKLGEGGMGEVYRARDIRLGRDVAIKILPQVVIADPDRLVRFEREARVLASLNHPNIGAIYGVEEADGLRGLVLELVEGRRSPIASAAARCRWPRLSPSRSRWPMRSTPPTSAASSTEI